MSDIFISYKREEQATARKLANALETQGWCVWWGPKLRAGERFNDVIEKALKESKCVVVMWSKRSMESPPTLPSKPPTRPQLLLNSTALDRLGALAIYLRSEKRWFKIPIRIRSFARRGSVITGTRTEAERRRTHGGEKDKEV